MLSNEPRDERARHDARSLASGFTPYCFGGCSVSGLVCPASPVVDGSSAGGGVAGGGVVCVSDSEPLIVGSVVEGSVVPGSVVVDSGIVSVVADGSVVSDVSVAGEVASCRAHAEASSNAPMDKNNTLRFKVHLTVSGVVVGQTCSSR
jgi:hypothetical protein